MAISAKDAAALRAQTGAGMMDCKKALEAANGDMDKATEILRERGVAVAAKKASRIASEGAVAACVSADRTTAALVEVNCESDFVAKTDDFLALANDAAKIVVENNPADVDALLAVQTADGTVLIGEQRYREDRRKDRYPSFRSQDRERRSRILYSHGRQDRRSRRSRNR